MNIPFETVNHVLDGVLTVLAIVLGSLAKSNARAKTVAIAVAAAEHAVDKAAFNDDGTLNTAREQFALAVLDRVLPHADPATIKADLETILETVHKHAAETPAPAAPVAPTPTSRTTTVTK